MDSNSNSNRHRFTFHSFTRGPHLRSEWAKQASAMALELCVLARANSAPPREPARCARRLPTLACLSGMEAMGGARGQAGTVSMAGGSSKSRLDELD